MAKISAADMKLFDEVFVSTSGPGYVLDFSDRTFSDFFRNDVDINIDDPKYFDAGGSKGKRLRTFLQKEPEATVARGLRALWDYRDAIINPSNNPNYQHQQMRYFKLVETMEGKSPSVSKPSPSPELQNKPTKQSIIDLNKRFLEMMPMNPQQRGFAFERFLSDLFGLYNLDPRHSFRAIGEQIDGSFEISPDTFLLEAKWQNAPIGQADLLTFSGKVEAKAQWSRGLFVSYSGFSSEGLEAFIKGRRTSIICMDGLDLSQILSNNLDFIEVIKKKKRRAAETGSAFVPVRDLFSEIT